MKKRIVEGDDFSLLPPVVVRLWNRVFGRSRKDEQPPVTDDATSAPDSPTDSA